MQQIIVQSLSRSLTMSPSTQFSARLISLFCLVSNRIIETHLSQKITTSQNALVDVKLVYFIFFYFLTELFIIKITPSCALLVCGAPCCKPRDRWRLSVRRTEQATWSSELSSFTTFTPFSGFTFSESESCSPVHGSLSTPDSLDSVFPWNWLWCISLSQSSLHNRT